MRFGLALIAGIALPAAAASAQDPAPVTDLAAALQLALRHPEVQAAQARERAGLARVDAAQAAFGPSLDAEASYGYAHDSFDQRSGPAVTLSGFSLKARAALSQPLFASGRLGAGLLQAEADRELQHQARRLAESQRLLGAI